MRGKLAVKLQVASFFFFFSDDFFEVHTLRCLGAVVLAPWAEDGFEYEATVEEVDEAQILISLGLKIRKLLF